MLMSLQFLDEMVVLNCLGSVMLGIILASKFHFQSMLVTHQNLLNGCSAKGYW